METKHLGRIYHRDKTTHGKIRRTYNIDFGKAGRVWSIPGSARRSMPITSVKQAEGIVADVRAAMAHRGKTLEEALARWLPKASAELSFGKRYDLWIEDLEGRVEDGELADSYVRVLRSYNKVDGHLESLRDVLVGDLTYKHIDDLVKVLRQRKLSAKTRKHIVGALRTFLRWLKRREDIAIVPELPAVTVGEYTPTIISVDAQRAVLDAIPEDRRGIFLALAYHGLRPSEACRLDVRNYDRREGVILPESSKMKTKTARRIRVSPELREWLDARKDRIAAAPLFQDPSGRTNDQRWRQWTLWNVWGAAARSLGLDVSLYEGTKHSSATNARRAGVELETIQEALGHADSKSTRLYARLGELAPVEIFHGKASPRVVPLKRPRK